MTKPWTAQALYDLHSDPGETRDVSARYPEVVERLEGLLDQGRNELGDSLVNRRGTGLREPDANLNADVGRGTEEEGLSARLTGFGFRGGFPALFISAAPLPFFDLVILFAHKSLFTIPTQFGCCGGDYEDSTLQVQYLFPRRPRLGFAAGNYVRVYFQ